VVERPQSSGPVSAAEIAEAARCSEDLFGGRNVGIARRRNVLWHLRLPLVNVIVELLGFAGVNEDQVFRLVGVGLDVIKLPLAVAGGHAFES
jgi:hypothetical protein